MKHIWILLALTTSILYSENFEFKYEPGRQFKMISNVDQDVYVNGDLNHQANILDKISFKILEAEDSSGFISAQFNLTTSHYEQGQVINSLDSQYTSEFWRDARGHYDIDPSYYMPVARNVPILPDRDIQIGDTWTALGEEVHDLREVYGIEEPYHLPFVATYKFEGYRDHDGRSLPVISVKYSINQRTGLEGDLVPLLFQVESAQVLFWDPDLGWTTYAKESYYIKLYLSTGDMYEFTGIAEGYILEVEEMDRDKVASDINKDIQDSGLGETQVVPTEKGVSLVMDDIQFYPDSDELLPGEEDKLQKIGNILKKYPSRDLLIEGFTADIGSRDSQLTLSEKRAQKVGSLLLSWGVRNSDQLLFRGWGGQKPVATNETEEGRKKNRRVEITILEN
ncbi:OmpA family protein [Spirochaeta cellobiosiphila]|uniref:OmpA family protein n=1 Tax=Spirochaeta cellobiosiphila TaxID=504483 RepID=UPI00146DF78E|nr:OmpA family protein [Spirochaeta cellobiosiphila]